MKAIWYTGPGKAELIELNKPVPQAGEVLVKLVVSTISPGTERANLVGERNISLNPEKCKAGICRGFKNGTFYASNALLIHEMVIEDGVLRMRCTPARHIQIVGADCDAFDFRNLDGSLIEEIRWPVKTAMRYFRVVVIDDRGRRAWCKPIFTEELLDAGIL